jgi:hypothetical protein
MPFDPAAFDFSQIQLVAATDPTGHGQPAAEIVCVQGDVVLHSGHFVYLHANQRVRAFCSNAESGAEVIFEITTAAQSLPGGNGRLAEQPA